MAGLFGVMHAGATVVPMFPPAGKRAAERGAAILRGCSAHAVMVDGDRKQEDIPAELPVLEISEEGTGEDFDGLPADPALLQYTSGSTADPKGVVLTHENLMSNCAALTAHIGHEPHRVGLTWLPPYHDMGLVGTLMFALYGGWPLVMMDPGHFVQAPARWLRAVSDFGVTITVSPPFALKLCVESIVDEEIADIDLSCLRQLFCGSEPLSPHVLGRFTMRFGSRGLSPTIVIPCYGLAEATLFVTGKRADERVRVDGGVVSCGVPAAGHEVFIVDPGSGKPCPDGQVGEVLVRGPSVAAGYFRAGAATEAVFRAGPHQDALRTGDLGYLRAGELFVTGRISGLIVVAGRNLHPHDIEATANHCHAAVFRSVAFCVPGTSGEDLVVVAERRVTTGLTEVRAAITAAVAARHGVRPRDVEFVGIGRIPTTTSGKLRRAEARRRYLEAAL